MKKISQFSIPNSLFASNGNGRNWTFISSVALLRAVRCTTLPVKAKTKNRHREKSRRRFCFVCAWSYLSSKCLSWERTRIKTMRNRSRDFSRLIFTLIAALIFRIGRGKRAWCGLTRRIIKSIARRRGWPNFLVQKAEHGNHVHFKILQTKAIISTAEGEI